MSRTNRDLGVQAALALLLVTGVATTTVADAPAKIPVIFDTDIGDDIDDTWALIQLVRCPELDVRLVCTDYRCGDYRARLAARFLQLCGRADIPIGIGHGSRDGDSSQRATVEGYDLADYPGTIHEDGAQALIDAVHASPSTPTIIAVGPSPNLAEALRRDPSIAPKARLSGMYGSLRVGYGGSDTPVPEHNVRAAVDAFRTIVAAPWERITITPLDTCGLVDLKGERFARLYGADDPALRALMKSYAEWAPATDWFTPPPAGVTGQSSILYDSVAIYLAIEEDLCEMEELRISVTDDGRTVIDPAGHPVRAATAWRDLEAYKDWLTERMLGDSAP